MESLFRRNRRLLEETSTRFVRSLMTDIDWDVRLLSIRGMRGVGKTTLMLQRQKTHYGVGNHKALYVPMDSPYFSTHTLEDLAEQFYLEGGECLFLDEVHKYEHWAKYVKFVYDSFPRLKLVISGSSLLQILNAEADLSRRCINYNMNVLSYREYLQFYHNIRLPVYTLEDILTNADNIVSEICHLCRPTEHFKDYLERGGYPFLSEGKGAYQQRLANVIDTVLNIELPQLCGVDVGNIRKLYALLVVIANNVPMLVDTTKLAKMTGASRTTVLSYLQHLDRSGLVRLLYCDELSVKKMQKPDKVLMGDTNLLHTLSLDTPNIGTVRETFFCNQLGYNHKVEYLKHQGGDFLIDGKYAFEVGGSAKDGKQIARTDNAFIAADDMEYAYGNKLPLYLFGLMY